MFKQNFRKAWVTFKNQYFVGDHADDLYDLDYYVSFAAMEFICYSLSCEVGVQYC